MEEIDSSSAPQCSHSQADSIRDTLIEIKNGTGAPETLKYYKSFATLTKQGRKEKAEMERRRKGLSREEGERPGTVMFRVERDLREQNAEHFVAQNVSLGLFDRFSLNMHQSIAEKWKLLMAGAFLETTGFGCVSESAWEQLCKTVVPNPEEIQDLYVESRDEALSEEEIQIVLTLDAVFVTCVLIRSDSWFLHHCPAFSAVYDSGGIPARVFGVLVEDLFKVENQLPVALIRNVLQILVEMLESNLDDVQKKGRVETLLSNLRRNAVFALYDSLPGADDTGGALNSIRSISFKACDGFLDCLYHFMSEGIEVSKGDGTKAKIDMPSATELQKAGVQFVGRKGNSFNVDFDPGLFTATLYLPTVDVWDDTEEIWRNLLAHEDLQSYNDDCTMSFTYYVYLMDSLIDTPDDVNVLRSGTKPVIGKGNIGDEDVTRIFNKTLINQISLRFTNESWNSTFKKIHDYYSVELRKRFWEFVLTNFGKPWLTISVIAATVLLVMTFLQTYYTMAGYYQIN